MEALTFTGSATSCKVFTGHIEATAEAQIAAFLDCPAFAGCQIRIMPDVHAGAGAVIGFTSPVGPGVCPNVIGVDIGCGVMAVRLGSGGADFPSLDAFIRRLIPSGFSVRQTAIPREILDEECGEGFADSIEALAVKVGCEPGKVLRAVGSLGGGNHFIEVDQDRDGDLWLTLHSGSRNFGLRVATYHQKIAESIMGKCGGLAWLECDNALAYLSDMRIAQRYAGINRLTMAREIVGGFFGFDLGALRVVESVHNFIGADDIIRKGAISARCGEPVVIPWNMRDGLILGEGLGAADWNYSAPHGAGRRMGRKEAHRTLSVDVFTAAMADAGVWSSCVGKDTLDEAPEAYKPYSEIEAWLGETVRITNRLFPVYNFKASEERV